jgi:hypothetical protein
MSTQEQIGLKLEDGFNFDHLSGDEKDNLGVHLIYRTREQAQKAALHILDGRLPKARTPQGILLHLGIHEYRPTNPTTHVEDNKVTRTYTWEFRTVSTQTVEKTITVDGVVYTHESREVTYTEWQPLRHRNEWSDVSPFVTEYTVFIQPFHITFAD